MERNFLDENAPAEDSSVAVLKRNAPGVSGFAEIDRWRMIFFAAETELRIETPPSHLSDLRTARGRGAVRLRQQGQGGELP